MGGEGGGKYSGCSVKWGNVYLRQTKGGSPVLLEPSPGCVKRGNVYLFQTKGGHLYCWSLDSRPQTFAPRDNHHHL